MGLQRFTSEDIETIGMNWFGDNLFKIEPNYISYDISDLK